MILVHAVIEYQSFNFAREDWIRVVLWMNTDQFDLFHRDVDGHEDRWIAAARSSLYALVKRKNATRTLRSQGLAPLQWHLRHILWRLLQLSFNLDSLRQLLDHIKRP